MVTVTKKQAAEVLIRGAVKAMADGDDICALTLAGAAEEAMPRPEGPDAFTLIKALRSWVSKSSMEESGRALNV